MFYFKKLISYFAYYEFGEKKKNCGHSRILVKDQEVTVEIHIKGLGTAESCMCEIYATGGERSQLGRFVLDKGTGYYNACFHSSDMDGRGLSVFEMTGLHIHIDENKYCETEWSWGEVPQQYRRTSAEPETGADTERRGFDGEYAALHGQITRESSEILQEPVAEQKADMRKESVMGQKADMSQEPMMEQIADRSQKPATGQRAEVRQGPVIRQVADMVQEAVDRKETAHVQEAVTGKALRIPQETSFDSKTAVNKEEQNPKTMGSQEEGSYKESPYDKGPIEENRYQAEPEETEQEAAVSVGAQFQETAVETESKKMETVLHKSQMEVREVGIPYKSNREEMPLQERLHEDKWKQLCCLYPVCHPFGADEEYISIAPKDFVILRKEYQNLVSNSFLLHSFYNYHHVILGKSGDQNDEVFYIGAPGAYLEREKKVAVMFGFEGFALSERGNRPRAAAGDAGRRAGNIETGAFGYYMRKVEI